VEYNYGRIPVNLQQPCNWQNDGGNDMSKKDDKDLDEKAFKEAYDEAMEYTEKECHRIWEEAQKDPLPDWWDELMNPKS
jgi:hypothetical protein